VFVTRGPHNDSRGEVTKTVVNKINTQMLDRNASSIPGPSQEKIFVKLTRGPQIFWTERLAGPYYNTDPL
jgi:hypothetical protein